MITPADYRAMASSRREKAARTADTLEANALLAEAAKYDAIAAELELSEKPGNTPRRLGQRQRSTAFF
jgi:hypothetical protein